MVLIRNKRRRTSWRNPGTVSGASWFQDPKHWELQDGTVRLILLVGILTRGRRQFGTVEGSSFEDLLSLIDAVMEGSRKARNRADWELLWVDDTFAGRGRTWGQWGYISFLPLLVGELPKIGNQTWLWHFKVSFRLRFRWRDNEWMKGLFSCGCEQPVPAEWVLATQGSL